MSDTWSDVCEVPTATAWNKPLVAVELDGFVGYVTTQDYGEGYLEVSDFLIYTGTIRSRMRIREGEDGFLLFGS